MVLKSSRIIRPWKPSSSPKISDRAGSSIYAGSRRFQLRPTILGGKEIPRSAYQKALRSSSFSRMIRLLAVGGSRDPSAWKKCCSPVSQIRCSQLQNTSGGERDHLLPSLELDSSLRYRQRGCHERAHPRLQSFALDWLCKPGISNITADCCTGTGRGNRSTLFKLLNVVHTTRCSLECLCRDPHIVHEVALGCTTRESIWDHGLAKRQITDHGEVKCEVHTELE